MILLKNMKTKVAMLAPCKNGSTSIESAWRSLLSNYEKKHECKIKNLYTHDQINLTKYKKIYLLTRPVHDWYLSGYRMGIKLYPNEFPKPPENFEQHLLEVKKFYQQSRETAHLEDRTVMFKNWNPQWVAHCAMNSKWIHKYVLQNSPHVEYININNTEKFQSTIEKIHPKLKVLHINKTSTACTKCNREFDAVEDQLDLVREIINTI